MTSTLKPQTGFTLIEVIASLVIIGILGAIAGMGIVNGTRGYLQARENAHLAQKAQIAMARIYRELLELTDVPSFDNSGDPWVVIDNPQGRLALRQVGSEVQLCALDATDTDPSDNSGDTLVDQVDSLALSYYQTSDTSATGPTWNTTLDIELLSAVEVKLGLRRREGTQNVVEFTGLVHPRNTNNFGGAPPTSDPVTAKQYECFISAAAGDPAGAFAAPPPRRSMALAALALLALFWAVGGCRPRSAGRSNDSGNILVGLVVTMLIFAALGVGMLTMTGTSTTTQIMADSNTRAYYLAESGFRYAAGEYLNTVDANSRYGPQDERNQTLINLHNKTFTLTGGNQQFHLEVYPFYMVTRNYHAAGSTTLQLEFPGGQPAILTLPSTGTVKVADAVYTYGSVTGSAPAYDLGTINNGNGIMEEIYQNAPVQFIGYPAAAATVNNDGNLTLAAGDGGLFPEFQGKINIEGVLYGYDIREGDQLNNIRDAEDPGRIFSLTVGSDTEIVLEPFVQIRSQGTYGQGDTQATREVTYNVPIPGEPEGLQKITYYDAFDDMAAWQTPELGTYAATTVAGDSALKVTSTETGFGVEKSSLIAFNWSTTRINFASAHRLAGRFLTYDAQVKIGFDGSYTAGYWSDSNPDTNAPDGLPKYFVGGIAFRLDQNQNLYALTLMRGSDTTSPTPDRIDGPLVPIDQVPVIVLWEQTGDGTTRQWLAYSEIAETNIFNDDMESGTNGWSSNLAGDGAQWARATNRANSGSYAWTTSPSGSYDGLAGSYVDGDNIRLVSPPIDLSNVDSAVLSFWTWYRLYSCDDYGYVEISNDGFVWERLNWDCSDHCSWVCGSPVTSDTMDEHYTSNSPDVSGNVNGWLKKTYDISNYTGTGNSSVRIRFLFDRNNDPGKRRNGWWIDDVKILTKDLVNAQPDKGLLTDPSTQQIALMLRVIEAAVIEFNSGGTTPIAAGDVVTQFSGASGTVVFPPVLHSGSWLGGDAAGMLWLNKTSTTDFSGGALDVFGKGTGLATVLTYTPRTNLIKAYYGTVYQNGTPDGDLYDINRLANPRGTVKWPIDEGEPIDADRDYLTLLEWSPQTDASVQRLQDENGKFSIIASNSLTTPSASLFPATRPELGIFTGGHGAIRVYYDDMGVRLYYLSGSGFLTPIQQ
jgi:prepilin-type N-terminal cleavage/methylation domain-containing protein